MPKLKISQKQYDAIVLREHETRLIDSRGILSENLNESTQLLEEGWREVVLGVAMMLGIGLTGQNKIMAQTAVKNANTMAQIKSTLEDEAKMDELVDALKTKGMKDPASTLATNAEKVIDSYNKIASNDGLNYKVDIKAVNTLQALKGKLAQGYALTGAEVSTDTIKGIDDKLTITDTLEISLGTDNLFVTGGYTLSPAGLDVIKITIDSIEKAGGKIDGVDIESSTDAERIVKFMSDNDATGNIKLANLRTQSISNQIATLDSGVAITHREIPNNGSHVVSTQDFLKASKDSKSLAALRAKSSEFRYVKITIKATFEPKKETPAETPPELIKKYRFELVKVITATGNARHIKTQGSFKHTKFKCSHKKGKKGDKTSACYTF